MRLRAQFNSIVSLVVVVGSLVLSSCNAAPSSQRESTAETRASGHLTVGVRTLANNFDQSNSGTFAMMSYPVMDILVYLDPEARVIPGIAERWEISSDGLAHTFYIRKGVKFHDGSDLTGADVQFSIERVVAPNATMSESTAWRTAIGSVALKDEYTVVIRMKAPQFELISGMAALSGSSAVYPEKYIKEKGYDEWLRHPIGSGPYKVVDWQPGSRIELEALDSHWRVAPRVKSVTVLQVLEESTKVSMLKTGELDITDVSPDSVPALKAAGLRIIDHDGAAQWWSWPSWDMANPQKFALGDVRVRRALSLAINRQEMADKLYGGYAAPSLGFYLPRTAYFFDPNVLKPDPYDPEQAKKLLSDAGYPNGFETTIQDIGGGGILSTLNSAMAGYFRTIGVRTTLKPMEMAISVGMRGKPEAWGAIYSNISQGAVFNFERFFMGYHSKGSSRNINNSKLDALIEKVPTITDQAEKKRVALEAAVMGRAEYSNIPLLDLRTPIALSPKVGKITPIKGIVGLTALLETATLAK